MSDSRRRLSLGLTIVILACLALSAAPRPAWAQPNRLEATYQSADGSFAVPCDPAWPTRYEAPGCVVFTIGDHTTLGAWIDTGLGTFLTFNQLPWVGYLPHREDRQDGPGQVARGQLYTPGAPHTQLSIGAYETIQLPRPGAEDEQLTLFLWRAGVEELGADDEQVLAEAAAGATLPATATAKPMPDLATALLHAIVPQNGPIVFLSTRDYGAGASAPLEAYAMQPDGSRQVRLTSQEGGWAKQAGLYRTLGVAGNFYAVENGRAMDDRILCVFENADFGANGPLYKIGGVLPAWSPNLEQICYADSEAGGPTKLFVMTRKGEHRRQISDPPGGAQDLYPVWSPDGQWIAFIREGSESALYKAKPDGSELTRLARGYFMRPVWSPDGSQLLFESLDQPNAKTAHLWLIGADGQEARQLLETPATDVDCMAGWSPDGEAIAFTVADGQDVKQIYVVRADGNSPRQITSDGDNRMPAWMPTTMSRPQPPQAGSSAVNGAPQAPSDPDTPEPAAAPFQVVVPDPLPKPVVPAGWKLYSDTQNHFVMPIPATWKKGESLTNPSDTVVFTGVETGDVPGYGAILQYGDAFVPTSNQPEIEFMIKALGLAGRLATNCEGLSGDSAWEDGVYRTLVQRVDLLDDLNALTWGSNVIAIPKGRGAFAVLLLMTPARTATPEDLQLARQITAGIRFGKDADAAAAAARPAPTPKPKCFEYVGTVDDYANYPGMGIEVHIVDAAGKPVPGVKVRTHAYNTEFWDITAGDGAFRRDGFTQAIPWDVELDGVKAQKLGVPFQANTLAIVTFKLQPCQ